LIPYYNLIEFFNLCIKHNSKQCLRLLYEKEKIQDYITQRLRGSRF